MGRSLRHERQVLNADEIALVEASHHPGLGALSDKELAELRKHVRERRDRARDIAARQRREIRGKAAPKGARPVIEDAGSREKRDVLAAAMQRLNREATRREEKAARELDEGQPDPGARNAPRARGADAAPRRRRDAERRHER